MKRLTFIIMTALALFSCNHDEDPNLATKDSGIYINGKLLKHLTCAYSYGCDPYPETSYYNIMFFSKYISQEEATDNYTDLYAILSTISENGENKYKLTIKGIPKVGGFLIYFDENMELIDNEEVVSASWDMEKRDGGRNYTIKMKLVDGRIVKFRYNGPVDDIVDLC